MEATAVAERSAPPKPKARKLDPLNAEFEEKAKALIRYAMAQRSVDVDGLTEKLNAMGVVISSGGVANKISRGGFSSAFLIQCMEALDINLAALPK